MLFGRLATSELPLISREYGQQLEFTGDYPAALANYERGILSTQVSYIPMMKNMKMGKNVRPELLITVGAPYFQVFCDGLLLYGQTTAISKSRYYAWKICKI